MTKVGLYSFLFRAKSDSAEMNSKIFAAEISKEMRADIYASKSSEAKAISTSYSEFHSKMKNLSNPTLTARHRTKKSFRRSCSIMISIFIIFELSTQKNIIIIFWNESERSPATVNSWKPKSANDGNYTTSTNEPASQKSLMKISSGVTTVLGETQEKWQSKKACR